MDKKFIFEYAAEHKLCENALQCILKNADIIEKSGCEEEFDRAGRILFDSAAENPEEYIAALDRLSEKTGIEPHELYLLFYIHEAHNGKLLYEKNNIDEQIIRNTFEDIVYKMNECKSVGGYYGISRPRWFYGYFRTTRFQLGRMQFELSEVPAVCELCGLTLKKGAAAVRIHIPDNGKAFDEASRLDAYKKAYGFFAEKFAGRTIPFVCSSWLLSPVNEKFLGKKSNIVGFSREFKIIGTEQSPVSAVWIFGTDNCDDVSALPEDNTLRKKYKQWLKNGNHILSAEGVFLFDGENIYNK